MASSCPPGLRCSSCRPRSLSLDVPICIAALVSPASALQSCWLSLGAAAALAAARRGFSPTPQVTPLMFLAIPLVDLVVFSILVGTAVAKRRKSATHKRLMLLATVGMLDAGRGAVADRCAQAGRHARVLRGDDRLRASCRGDRYRSPSTTASGVWLGCGAGDCGGTWRGSPSLRATRGSLSRAGWSRSSARQSGFRTNETSEGESSERFHDGLAQVRNLLREGYAQRVLVLRPLLPADPDWLDGHRFAAGDL